MNNISQILERSRLLRLIAAEILASYSLGSIFALMAITGSWVGPHFDTIFSIAATGIILIALLLSPLVVPGVLIFLSLPILIEPPPTAGLLAAWAIFLLAISGAYTILTWRLRPTAVAPRQ